jgi:hypothetical protein
VARRHAAGFFLSEHINSVLRSCPPTPTGTHIHRIDFLSVLVTMMVIIALVWIGMINTGTMSNYAPTTALIAR